MNSSTHIPTLFRIFKRHYHKVREISVSLANKGSFNLQIKFDRSNLRAGFRTADIEETIRFIVLMRRFLCPSDTLYYENIWERLLAAFAENIPPDVRQHINTLLARLKRGAIGVNSNGEDLTAEKIYQVLNDGVFFGHDEDIRKYLQSLTVFPVAGSIVLQQFYGFALNGYELVHHLFDLVLLLEKSQKYQALYGDIAPIITRCIYCLATTASFTSEEHIFPESLGNDELVLPKGYVCDKCNNELLSGLDNSLLKFEPIAKLQARFVPYTKDGKLPTANFQNLTIKRTSPRNITIEAKDKTANSRNKKYFDDGWVGFTNNMKGGKFRPKVLGRALYKIGLGMVAFSQGQEMACDPKYDLARDFIRDGHGFPNNLIIKKECIPHPQVGVAYLNFSAGTSFVIDIYGLIFLLNLEPEPVIALNEMITDTHFVLHSLNA